MLTFLRKHQYGFMLVVAIIVIVAFAFFDSAADRGRTDPESVVVFEFQGKPYTYRDLRAMQNQMTLLAGNRSDPYLGYRETYQKLTSERIAPGSGGVLQAFVYNLSIFREEAKALGIEASDAEVMAELKSNSRFRGPSGSYDGALFDNFKSNALAGLGLSPEQLLDLVRDKIRIDKLSDLLAAGVTAPAVEVEARYQQENEKVVAYAFPITMEQAKEGLEIPEEKIKEHYDKNVAEKKSLKTEEKRRVEFAFFPDPTKPNPPRALRYLRAIRSPFRRSPAPPHRLPLPPPPRRRSHARASANRNHRGGRDRS